MTPFDSENPEVPKPSTPPQPTPEEQAYREFAKKHVKRCDQWARDHGNVNFPIVVLPNGTVIWLNREQRRRIEMEQRRHFKRKVRQEFRRRQLELQKSLRKCDNSESSGNI